MSSPSIKRATTIEKDERIPDGVVLSPVENIAQYELGPDVVVYNPLRAATHVLNETAAVVWWLCDGQQTVAQVIAKVADIYKVDLETAADDVDEILTQFMLAGLVE